MKTSNLILKHNLNNKFINSNNIISNYLNFFISGNFVCVNNIKFYSIIPHRNISKKSSTSFQSFIINFNCLNQSSFIDNLMCNLHLNTTYSLLINISYTNNFKTYSCGRQRGLYILDKHDISYYQSLYTIILNEIELIMLEYNLSEYPELLIIKYKISNSPKYLLNSSSIPLTINKSESTNLGSISENTLKDLKLNLFSKYLPLSLYINSFFYSIEFELKYKFITDLINQLKLSGTFFSSIFVFPKVIQICNIFLGKISKNLRPIIIELKLSKVNELDSLVSLEKFNPILKKLFFLSNYDLYYRLVYDLNTGFLLREIVDISINNKLIRVIGNSYLSIDIKTNKIIKYCRYKWLDSIKNPIWKFPPKNMPNNQFGVLDVETYIDSNTKISKVYAIGFTTFLDQEKINTFYLSDIFPSLNSNYLIIISINSILIPKYHNYIFYIHNMGHFDIVFIYKTLKEYNLNYGSEYYKMDCIFRENSILKLTVKIKHKNNKYIKITFVDSYNILSHSLHKLYKDFGVNTVKSHFPYYFVNQNTLNYSGLTPDISYYPDLSLEDYKLHHLKSNWELKKECQKYLESDLKCLLEILEKFNYSLFVNHNIQMCEGLTISRLALNKFLFYYLKDSKLPLINNFELYNFIYFGYYGGRTEVFKPYGTNLIYFDKNSLYPYAALRAMPGCDVNYLENFTEEGLNLDDLFGFFLAEVDSAESNKYLGLLPVKTSEGIIYPNGRFSGIWSSEELKFAKSKGYKVKVIKGYNFNKVENVFTEYVQDLYNKKLHSSGSEKAVNKSLLNNLLGRIGLNIIKPKTKSVNSEKLDYIISTRKVLSLEEVTNNDFLITYNPIIQEDICLEHGLDYIKVLNNEHNFKLDKQLDLYQDVSIAISAMVTSYARIIMNEILLLILEKGGNIYYMDTDSIVTDLDLSKILLDLVGNELGKFKVEYKIKEGYFISNKTYCLVLEDGTTVIKAKGVNKKSLTVNDFKDMLLETKNISALRRTSTKIWSEGSVTIEDKEILLSSTAYSKRTKIYNEKGIWIETSPLYFNNLEKNLVKKDY